ncbi:MAG: acyltransferase family protein [bacterium]
MLEQNRKILYIENLRILLTILIIMLHIAVTYGSAGSWYYYERSDDAISNILLTMFTAVVQSFSLGFFFLISAYFTPASFERKGLKSFLKSRLLHLGIPFVFYYFVINPLILYILKTIFMGEHVQSKNLFGPGPLWFVETLFIFNMVYALWAGFSGMEETGRQRLPPRNKNILVYLIILSFINFIIRMFCPAGKWFFDFQPAFYPGYISLFITGIIAGRNKWFDNFPETAGKRWLIVSLTLILLLPFIMFFSGAVNDVSPFLGGFTWQSLLYSSWEAFTGVGIIAGLFVIFRKKFNRQGDLAKIMSDNAYPVYIFHPPVIVFLAYSVRNVLMHPLLKFLFVSIAGVPLCFLISRYIIKKIPFAKKIL